MREVVDLDPGHVGASTYLAINAVRDGETERALEIARRLRHEPETKAEGLALEGRVQAATGDNEAALEALMAAHRLEPRQQTAVDLARLKAQTDAPEPLAELEGWVADNPDDLGASRALGILYQQADRRADAVRIYHRVLEKAPDDATTLNNLAFLYLDMGDARALETARRAYENRPDDPAITDTLGWVLVNQGEYEKGVKLLRKAVKALPNVPDVGYHLAYGLAKIGAVAEARQVLTETLGSRKAFADQAAAEALLHRLNAGGA
jgi:Flp pilus assembly protein TadD